MMTWLRSMVTFSILIPAAAPASADVGPSASPAAIPSPSAPRAANPIEIRLVDSDWPPFFFKGQPNERPGLAKEILQKCVPAAGGTPRFSFLPVARLFESLKDGSLDLAILSRTTEREAFIEFGSEPVFELRYRPFVKKGRKLALERPSDFDPLRLGRLAGLQFPNPDFLSYVEKRERKRQLEIFKTPEAGLRMLVEDRIDTFVGNVESTLYLAKTLGLSNTIETLDYDVSTAPYFVGQSKASPRVSEKSEFVRKVDSCIAEAKRSGEMDALRRHYGIHIQTARP